MQAAVIWQNHCDSFWGTTAKTSFIRAMNSKKYRQPYFIYLHTIGIIGVVIICAGLIQIPNITEKPKLLLIITLAVLSNIFVTSAAPSDESIAFEVGTAISMSLIVLFSPVIAAISAAACSIGIWLYLPKKRSRNKRTAEQLLFNAGMHSVAIFAAGSVFTDLLTLPVTDSLGWKIAFWVVAAIVHDQLNFWLLMALIKLKQGTAVKPYTVWRENLWAVPINILILSVGGGALAYAATTLGEAGIFVFCLPVILSALAFRLYENQMQDHLKNLETIVSERTSAIKTALAEKDAFLAVLSHDMKSPLTSIHLNASIIKDKPHILKDKPHMIDAILYSQQALIDMVNNILDIEKLQSGGELPIQKVPFEFIAAANKVFQIILAQAEKKKIDCQLIGTGSPIMVFADRQQMERILHNLLTNAIKYTPPKGCIVLTMTTSADELCLEVKDSGYGIPVDELPFVFERFHRVAGHKKLVAGTGLGLAITKALVAAHNGRINVQSEVGKGSIFSASLPILLDLNRVEKCHKEITF